MAGGDASDGRASQCRNCGHVFGDEVNFCPDCGSAIRDVLAAHCRMCGSEFDPDDRFCSDCGAVRNPDAEDADASGAAQPGPSGSESAPDFEEETAAFRRRVQSYLAEGWELDNDYGDSVVLVDRDIGSLPAHVLLFLFTGGIGNALYGFHRYKNCAERLRLSAGEERRGGASSTVHPAGETVSESGNATRVVLGAVLALGGLSVLLSLPLEVVGVVIGLPLLLGGLYLFPPVRQRIDRRHSVTRLGTVRSTDETVVRTPDTPCVACGRPIDTGVKRTYREEAVLAGIPLFTRRDGENHYCEACSVRTPEPERAPDDGATEPAASTDATEREPN